LANRAVPAMSEVRGAEAASHLPHTPVSLCAQTQPRITSNMTAENELSLCLITAGLLGLIGGVVAAAVVVKLDSTLAEAPMIQKCPNDPVQLSPSPSLGVFIGFGQSNSGCFGELAVNSHVHSSHNFQFFQNNTHPYKEPMCGSRGPGGCIYGYLGESLIASHKYNRTVFATGAIGGARLTTITDKNSQPYKYLVAEFNNMYRTFNNVDGILFHQGESDHNAHHLDGYLEYRNVFSQFVQNLQDDLMDPNFKIYVSRATYCNNNVDLKLSKVQDELQTLPHVFGGPNTDSLLGRKWRNDGCHFSALGLREVASMWMDVLF